MSQMPKTLVHRWTPRVLFELSCKPMHFNAIQRAIEAPSARMLSQLLKRLARDGILERHVIAVGPPASVRYSLTTLGIELQKSTEALVDFWRKNAPEIQERRFVNAEAARADAARQADAGTA
jgi:DNA-binding HxlR family transcriptional regulator